MNDFLSKQQIQKMRQNHDNLMSILELRLKVMGVLKSYLQKDLVTNVRQQKYQRAQYNYYNNNERYKSDFTSCLRLLNNEQSLSIVNDGIMLVVNFLVNNYPTVKTLQILLSSSSKLSIENFQQSLIKLLSRLILSKYQSHVENGLEFLFKVYNYFHYTQNNNHPNHKSIQMNYNTFSKSTVLKSYQSILSSKRIQKILKQQKRQKLWQLAYMLKVKFTPQQ